MTAGFVVFATAAGNAKVDEYCQHDDFNGLRDIFIFDRQIGSVTAPPERDVAAGDLPGASGAPVISGNGNLLLFRTQAVNGGGASTPRLVVEGLTDDGKSTTGQVPSPTTHTPPPADVPPAPPTGSTEDPATSGDGNTTGTTTEPDPGHRWRRTGRRARRGARGRRRHAVHRRAVAGSGTDHRRQRHRHPGRELCQRPDDGALGLATPGVTFVNSSLLRVTAPAAPGGVDGLVTVRVIVNGEASNEVEYSYVTGLTSPTITSFNPTTGSTAGGNAVIIIGTGFSGPTRAFRPDRGQRDRVERHVDHGHDPRVRCGRAGADRRPEQQRHHRRVEFAVHLHRCGRRRRRRASSRLRRIAARSPAAPRSRLPAHSSLLAPTVTVGGVAATDVQVLSNTQIVAVTPAGAEGPQPVVVTVYGTASRRPELHLRTARRAGPHLHPALTATATALPTRGRRSTGSARPTTPTAPSTATATAAPTPRSAPS